MRKDAKKSICIRLSSAEFACLVELANDQGDTHTSAASKLVVKGLQAAQGKTTDKIVEKLICDLERKLTRTIFAMLTTVANHDEKSRIEFRDRTNELLKGKGAA